MGTENTNLNFKAVRVKDIILSQDHPEFKKYGNYDSIGTIKYTDIETDEGTGLTAQLKSAKPLFSFIKQYPIIDEIVLLIPTISNKIYGPEGIAASDNYYLPNINIWNHPNHNCLPTFYDYNEYGEKKRDYRLAAAGAMRAPEDGSTELDFGKYFEERLNVQPLLPFEGDTILEGRWGNSIRLGSTSRGAYDKTPYSTEIKGKNTRGDEKEKIEKISENGDPITIIRNGQLYEEDDRGWEHTVENINQDHSSIYMTSNQVISNFKPVSTHWESWMAKSGDLEVDDDFENLAKGPNLPKVKEIDETEEEQKIKEEELLDDNETEEDNILEESTEDDLLEVEVEEEDELSIYDEVLEEEDFMEGFVQWIDAEGDTVVTQAWSVDESSRGTIIANEDGKKDKKVTSEMIAGTTKQGCDNYPVGNINKFLAEMSNYSSDYPIFANKYMKVGMLSVAAKECSLSPKGEKSYKNTSNQNMRKVFKDTLSHMTDTDLNELKANWDEEKWWDITYGYLGAGNKVNFGSKTVEWNEKFGAGRAAQYDHTEKGDGYKYRGRGMIQLTWKTSYKKYGKIMQKVNGWDSNKILDKPDLVNTLEYAIQSALAYTADHFRYPIGHKHYKKWGVIDPAKVDNYLAALGMMYNQVAGWGRTKSYVDSHEGYLKMQKNYQCFTSYVE
tara:strand:+ start:168 stop:2177 length:2010 start_codon:yes stop_codon:yes gene_type:complete